MSTAPTPPAAPPPAPAPRPRRAWGCLFPAVLAVLFLSVLFNLATMLVYVGAIDNPLESDPNVVDERFYLGDPDARDKIAVVRVSGVLTDGGIQYPIRQLEAAARDKRVRAVVLRINSPGGTVTSSEELYQNVVNLRDNTGRRFKGSGPKPVSVSMGGLAASGGYYVAMAGKPIAAEPTTITGSIGVFAALPNAAQWTKEHGIRLELIKAGDIKAAGSFFHTLSPEERQTWQDTVDNAYELFLNVIAANRPLTAKELRETVVIDRTIPKRDEKGNVVTEGGKEVTAKYTRLLADGGTFTAPQAKQFKLIDEVQDLPATIRATAAAHGIGSFKAVVYEPRRGLVERLVGLQLAARPPLPDLAEVSSALTPRLWYLAPTADSGLLTPDR